LAWLYSRVIDSIEQLLTRQLEAAIGSEITSSQFGEYMRFHQRNILLPAYQAADFSVAVRRPKHDPEGRLQKQDVRQRECY